MKKLIGNLNLNRGANEGQALYHSQVYGTFFGVYAFIESKETGDSEERIVTSMTLQVVNYKGVLNLGIEKATFKDGDIELIMRAMSEKTENIPVEGIEGHAVTRGKTLRVKRFLLPIHSNNSNENIALQNGIFDSEFHYREGILEGQNTLKPLGTAAKPIAGGRPTEPEGQFIGQAASGWFCPFAELMLIWFP